MTKTQIGLLVLLFGLAIWGTFELAEIAPSLFVE